MIQGVNQDAVRRTKRVQRLKKIIILTLLISILIPYLLCIVLFVKLNGMSKELDELNTQVERLIQVMAYEDVNSPPVGNMPDYNVTDDNQVSDETLDTENDAQPMHKHMVYLTFDDGPSIYTDEILDILDEYDVKATFFVVGKEDEISKSALKRIVEEGHTLGMHSYSHKYMEIYHSVDAFSEDFYKLQEYLYDVTGVKSIYYRFPGGSSNTVSTVGMDEFADFLDSQGVIFYDWNIASGDATNHYISVDALVKNSTYDIENWQTSIILMHDSADKHSTVEALPQIIENIMAMDDTVILPITESTRPVQHIHMETNE